MPIKVDPVVLTSTAYQVAGSTRGKNKIKKVIEMDRIPPLYKGIVIGIILTIIVGVCFVFPQTLFLIGGAVCICVGGWLVGAGSGNGIGHAVAGFVVALFIGLPLLAIGVIALIGVGL